VALPLPSKTAGFGLNVQVGEPVCLGCTEQESDTELSRVFSKVSLTIEVAVSPRVTVAGLSGDACRGCKVRVVRHSGADSEFSLTLSCISAIIEIC
jgi:hypothetical protein